jgi:hypothetical protein
MDKLQDVEEVAHAEPETHFVAKASRFEQTTRFSRAVGASRTALPKDLVIKMKLSVALAVRLEAVLG